MFLISRSPARGSNGWWWLALTVLSAGCGGSSNGDLFKDKSTDQGQCTAGQTVTCTGNDGCQGSTVCTGSGTPGACVCSLEGGAGGSTSMGGAGAGGSEQTESGGAGGTEDSSSGGSLGTGGYALDAGTGGHPGRDAAPEAAGPKECRPGHYEGTFSGPYTSNLLGQITTEGTLSFAVDLAGNVTGNFNGTSPVSSTSDLVGTVNCESGTLVGTMQNGTFTPFGSFEGTINGTYDPLTDTYAGEWTTHELTNSNKGGGSWTAQ